MYGIDYQTRSNCVDVILVEISDSGTRKFAWWIGFRDGLYNCLSASKPGYIERRLGVTWENKIAIAERKMIKVADTLNARNQYDVDCTELANEALRQYAIKKLGDEASAITEEDTD